MFILFLRDIQRKLQLILSYFSLLAEVARRERPLPAGKSNLNFLPDANTGVKTGKPREALIEHQLKPQIRLKRIVANSHQAVSRSTTK